MSPKLIAFLGTRGLTIAYILLCLSWGRAGNRPMAVYFAAAALLNESVLAMNH